MCIFQCGSISRRTISELSASLSVRILLSSRTHGTVISEAKGTWMLVATRHLHMKNTEEEILILRADRVVVDHTRAVCASRTYKGRWWWGAPLRAVIFVCVGGF